MQNIRLLSGSGERGPDLISFRKLFHARRQDLEVVYKKQHTYLCHRSRWRGQLSMRCSSSTFFRSRTPVKANVKEKKKMERLEAAGRGELRTIHDPTSA